MLKKGKIPLQQLLNGEYVGVLRFHEGLDALSPVAHRHDHYELILPTAGRGQQQINFTTHTIQPGRAYFLHPGQVHSIHPFDRDGWILAFGEALYSRFISFHRSEDAYGLLDPYGPAPYIDLTPKEQEYFVFILTSIREELQLPAPDPAILLHYVSLLLLQGNRLHITQHPQQVLQAKDKHIMNSLKQLLDTHLREEHAISFYAKKLFTSVRQLNRICMQSTGLTVYGLLQERLLLESKILLQTSPYSAKEISHLLGFKDPAYFGRFFKKHTGESPVLFRQKHQSVI